MNALYGIASQYLQPFASPFFLLGLLISINISIKKIKNNVIKYVLPVTFALLLFIIYRICAENAQIAKWLYRLNNPLFAVLAFIVVPAVFLPKGRFYKLFLILPLCAIIFAIVDIVAHYFMAREKEFHWFVVHPGLLISALAGILVIAQTFFSLDNFRRFTRLSALVVLLFGGFAFRQNYADYKAMLERRQNAVKDIMVLSETTPVMRYDNRLAYIPSAPCRFAADGGYVQGCVMELAQRIHQVNFAKISAGDPSEVSVLAMALGALLAVTVLAYIGARWWCGWICPLSTIGSIFDFARRTMGFSYIKPNKPVKTGAMVSGLTLSAFTLNLAYLYTKIDQDGKFMGCRLPAYPFCKICPGQMVCPAASMAQTGYFILPGMEWLFGFFKISVIALTGFFIIGFLTARRVFCRFCPMGMFGGIFNRGALLAIKKDSRKCNSCGICNESCPMDITLVQKEMVKSDVSSFDCIYCGKCVYNCPQDKCLSIEFAGKKVMESDFEKKMIYG